MFFIIPKLNENNNRLPHSTVIFWIIHFWVFLLNCFFADYQVKILATFENKLKEFKKLPLYGLIREN